MGPDTLGWSLVHTGLDDTVHGAASAVEGIRSLIEEELEVSYWRVSAMYCAWCSLHRRIHREGSCYLNKVNSTVNNQATIDEGAKKPSDRNASVSLSKYWESEIYKLGKIDVAQVAEATNVKSE